MNTSNFHTTFPAIALLIVSHKHARTSTQRALTYAGELRAMSKNNSRGISLSQSLTWSKQQNKLEALIHIFKAHRGMA